MNKNRCGNSDEDLEVGTRTFERATQKARTRPPKRTTRRRRRALDILDKAEKFRIREARSLDHLQKNGMLHQILKDGSNPHKMQSIRRRAEMLKEFKEKIEREPVIQTDPSKEEPNIVIDGVHDEPRLEHLREKRSAPVIELANKKAFQKKSVTWRLLTTSLSSHIPTSDQRSTLQLAFRMWSEVIPITFAESTEGPVSKVDIRIAFVTSKYH